MVQIWQQSRIGMNSVVYMITFIKKNKYSFQIILLLVLILVHGFLNNYFIIDNVTIFLIMILVLLPYVSYISKIKFGDFEAEITHDDIKSIEEKVEKIPHTDKVLRNKKGDNLDQLIEDDPTLAMAKLRIEIEKRVKFLSGVYLQESQKQFSLNKLLFGLSKNNIINQNLISLIKEVLFVANRAIHGESIEKKEAVRLIEYGRRIIEELDNVTIKRALGSMEKKVVITNKELDSYQEGNYILKTVISYVEKPEMRTYILNQAELESFLQGYDEYAEFIVGLEKK